LGILMDSRKGQDTRERIADAIDDFCKKHNINLSRKEISDLADDIKDAAADIAE